MTTAIVRPANRNDLDRLEAMISRVDRHVTMPSLREAMAARIERSLDALRWTLPPQNECYFLVMEEDGELLEHRQHFHQSRR
jgi:arginine/ornithine N-succinyltransferase beta subunit